MQTNKKEDEFLHMTICRVLYNPRQLDLDSAMSLSSLEIILISTVKGLESFCLEYTICLGPLLYTYPIEVFFHFFDYYYHLHQYILVELIKRHALGLT